MLFEAKQKIVFIGDSITDCGRRDVAAPYGDGYVSLVRSLLLARYPERQLQIVNKGIGGNTTRDLAARWQQDVIAERPDWLAVMIGINDVWRSFDSNGVGAVGLEEYTATLRKLLDQTRTTTSARLILAEPYMIEPDQNRPMRRQMDTYGAAVRQIAADYDAVLVRSQAAFDTALASTTPNGWADDSIHPNPPGHAIIGLAFLKAIGFDL
ncbi:MAG: SGNH/GDSL hydrolase family protein [Roseiflexaceae bacterium]